MSQADQFQQYAEEDTEPYTPPSYCRIYSAPIASSLVLISGLSCKTTFNKELWISNFHVLPLVTSNLKDFSVPGVPFGLVAR